MAHNQLLHGGTLTCDAAWVMQGVHGWHNVVLMLAIVCDAGPALTLVLLSLFL